MIKVTHPLEGFHTSVIQLSLSAFGQNIRFLQRMLGEQTRLSSVIKGNAYGHGIENIVPMAEQCGVDHFSVFCAEEAWRTLKASNGKSQIMIMGMLDNSCLEWAVENEISFFVFEMDRLQHAIRLARKTGKKAKIHIELETGMNRTGFKREALLDVIELIKNNQEDIDFQGLCTHFAGAESIANYYRIKRQRTNFRRYVKYFKVKGLMPKYLHTACSAAAVRYPNTRLDLARIGIMQYGFFPSQEILIDYVTQQQRVEDPLKRVITWKSKVMDVKEVKRGEFVSYGTSFLANQDMKVASIPVGYAHGYSRMLSNQGSVIIRGELVKVVGMVNMNLMLADVSLLGNVEKGEEVILIGKQGDMEVTVAAFGDLSSMVNYELLTRLPANIPRVVVE